MTRTHHVKVSAQSVLALQHRAAIVTLSVLLAVANATHAAPATEGRQDFVAGWQNAIREATDAARMQLQSDDLKEVAWGAFRAAEYRLDGLAPDIAAAIDRAPTEHPTFEQYAMLSALFDAAVQLDAAVPASLLKRFWQTFPVQTSALLARATGDRDATLLDLASSTKGLRWFAVANALLDAKVPGFAASLLKNVRFHVLFDVSEGGNKGFVEGGSSSSGVSDWIGLNPTGFPPIALYEFGLLPSKGDIVLSTGPRTLYYSRRVEYKPQFGAASFDVVGPTDEDRFRYVTAMGASEWQQMSLSKSEAVRWRDRRRLVEDVAVARSAVEGRYRALIQALVSAGRLTVEEANSLPKLMIEIKLVDDRDDKSIPLPDIR
jgi:hypothetical protein